MYIYQVGYHSHGECPKAMLSHHRLMAELEFDVICAEAFALAAKNEVDKWIDRGQATSISPHMTTIESCYDEFIKIMRWDYGFDLVKPLYRFTPFGEGNICNDIGVIDGDSYSDVHLKMVKEAAIKYDLHYAPGLEVDDEYMNGAD